MFAAVGRHSYSNTTKYISPLERDYPYCVTRTCITSVLVWYHVTARFNNVTLKYVINSMVHVFEKLAKHFPALHVTRKSISVHKRPLLFPILSQINQIHAYSFCFFLITL
jgi:hypothetical protein